jgi:hypothetical protein
MSQPTKAAVQVGLIHYQILCGAGLLLVFFAQFEQGMLLGNLLVVCIGLLGIVTGMRSAPLLVLVILLIAQTGHHLALFQTLEVPQQRPFFHLGDLLLAIGMLTYVAGHYRLQSLWTSAVPVDPRQRRRVPRRGAGYEQAQQPRSERTLTPEEMARFILGLPMVAIAGQLAWWLLAQEWLPEVFIARVMRLIVLIWALAVGMLLAGWLLSLWQTRQMSSVEAQLYLQDTLWRETRREQRRIFRWLAWRKVRDQESRPLTPDS